MRRAIAAALMASLGWLGVAGTWGQISVKRDSGGTCVKASYGVRVLDNEQQGSHADCRAL